MIVNEVQGNSRIFVGHKNKNQVMKVISKYSELELSMEMDTLDVHQDLSKQNNGTKEQLIKLLTDLKQQGKTIAAYGAPAKGKIRC